MDDTFKTGRVETITSSDPTGLKSIIVGGLRHKETPYRNRLFPSNSSVCQRQGAAGYFYDPELKFEVRADAQFYFKIGDAIQDVIEAGLRAQGRLLMTEYRLVGNALHPGFDVSGRIDLTIIDNDGGIANIEVKSCGKLPDKPKRSHIGQAMTYALLSGLDRAYILYQSRSPANWNGDVQMVIFPVEVTPAALKTTALTLARGLVYGRAGALPHIPDFLTKSHEVCGFCPLKTFCWEGKPKPGMTYHIPDAKEILELEAQAMELAKAVYDRRHEFLAIFMLRINSIKSLRSAHEKEID